MRCQGGRCRSSIQKVGRFNGVGPPARASPRTRARGAVSPSGGGGGGGGGTGRGSGRASGRNGQEPQGPTVMPSTQALARLTVELRSFAVTMNFSVTVLFAYADRSRLARWVQADSVTAP